MAAIARSRSLDANLVGARRPIASSNKLARTEVDLRQLEREALVLRRHASQSILEGLEWQVLGAAGGDAEAAPPRRARREQLTLALLVCANVVCGLVTSAVLEIMYSHDRECGTMVSLVEYTYCALVSSAALLSPRKLPLAAHLQLFAAGVGFSLLSNSGLASGLPMSLALVLKNGHVLANMAVGAATGKRYSRRQVLAVGTITAGLVLATVAQADAAAPAGAAAAPAGAPTPAADAPTPAGAAGPVWFGVLCMTGALLTRAAGGVVQERVFAAHGIQTTEMMFGRAVLGIPIFAARRDALGGTARRWAAIGPVRVLGVAAPLMWALLAVEVATDHGTKLATTRLIGETSALTVTLLFTLQRFLSLAVSAAVLSPVAPAAAPTLWAGIVLVGAGSVGYAL